MTVELWCLFGAMLMGIVHIGADSFSFKAQVGNDYTVGPRDEEVRREALAGRMHRAAANFRETFPLFAAAVLLVTVLDAENSVSEIGAIAYLAGRILYLPLYASGVKWIRTFSWNAATAGALAVILAPLF